MSFLASIAIAASILTLTIGVLSMLGERGFSVDLRRRKHERLPGGRRREDRLFIW